MTVLDAYAVIAYLRGEPAAAEVADLLRQPATLTSVNAAEVVDRMVRVAGRDADLMQADVALLRAAGLRVPDVTAGIAFAAARLRTRHYHRTRSPLSLADCIAAATSLQLRIPVATSDGPLAAAVHAEGGAVVALPDSRGLRPSIPSPPPST